MEVALLARMQFYFTAAYHFLYVPTTIGLGLILVIFQTRYYRDRTPEKAAQAHFWTKLFALSFAVGVATGITMEFSFGTNWADYSRFVGDIFGAPLAAEALLAFFLESTFLGILIFGRKKIGPKAYLASAWLVWLGSCLSALWILIANSWMQTPAGYAVQDGKAILTDFWAAAFNPSTIARYSHTVVALLIMGAMIAMAVGAYHYMKKDKAFGAKVLRVGVIATLVTTVVMVPAMHAQAKVVADHQPEKLAAMEGQYERGPSDLTIIGYVDEEAQEVVGIKIPGFTSWLASGDATTEYVGLNEVKAEFGETAPVQVTFQAYHIMVALFGVIVLWIILGLIASRKAKRGVDPPRLLLRLLIIGPIIPIIAIQTGWMTAEFGRQPWIVWGEMRTAEAFSQSVDATSIIITMVLFVVIYLFILIVFLKMFFKIVKAGPVIEDGSADDSAAAGLADAIAGAAGRGDDLPSGDAEALSPGGGAFEAVMPGEATAEGEVK